jgi:GAF domain-containing protein
LREKVSALENQLAKLAGEKNRVREHLLQSQRDLHVAETNFQEAESALAALRQNVEQMNVVDKEQKEKIQSLQLDYKSSARKSRQRFDAAIDIMKSMLVDAEFESLLQVVKSRLRIIVGAEKAEVYIVDRENNELTSYREKKTFQKDGSSSAAGNKLWKGRFPMDAGIVGAVIEEKAMQVVKEVEKDVRFDALVDGIGSNGVRNLIAYPVLVRQEVVAVIVVTNKLSENGRVAGDDFAPSDIAAVQDFAALASLTFLQQSIITTRSNAARIKEDEASKEVILQQSKQEHQETKQEQPSKQKLQRKPSFR